MVDNKKVEASDQLIVALDVPTFAQATELIDELNDTVNIFKVGSQLFTACGPVIVRHLMARGKKVFLDLKFHDIPNTVANAVNSAVNLCKEVHKPLDNDGVQIDINPHLAMCTIHTVGGEEMMNRAAEAAQKTAESIGVQKPCILGITVLTSEMNRDNIQQLVLERTRSALNSGLDGVVCSSQEVTLLREQLGRDFVIVTPGIRPDGAAIHDQKRVTTPREAILNGSDYIVVGRPIVSAEKPADVAAAINKDIQLLGQS